MRKNRKYYFICGRVKILCNGKIVRGNHEKEALDNYGYSKLHYDRVMMDAFLFISQ